MNLAANSQKSPLIAVAEVFWRFPFTLLRKERKAKCSLELGHGVDVPLEGSVVDVGAIVVQVGHRWLVHGAVPLNVPGASVAVPVHILVVLMVDRRLSCAPLAMSIGSRGGLGQHTSDRPVEEIWVVDESLGVEAVVVHHDGAVVAETAADTTHEEPADPAVGQPASHIEVLDGELTDDSKSEKDSELGARCVASPVEVGLVRWAHDHIEITAGEPALQDVEVVEGLGSPLELTLLENVLTDTEADQLAILNVVRDLRVDSSSRTVIMGVLINSKETEMRVTVIQLSVDFASVVCSNEFELLKYALMLCLPVQLGFHASHACTCLKSYRTESDLSLHSS